MSRETHRKGIERQQEARRAAAAATVGTCHCGLVVSRQMLDDHKAIQYGKSVICNECEGGS